MSDQQGAAGKTNKVAEAAAVDAPQWRVDGWESPEDSSGNGLSDTVVRMPRISATGPAPSRTEVPVLPEPPATRPNAFAPPADATRTPAAAAPLVLPTAPVGPPAASQSSKATSLRRTRKARLRLSRVDPWSVMKTSFLFSIAFGIMFWVATWVIWNVIIGSGLFEAINGAILNIISSSNNTEAWRIEDYINTNKVLGVAALIAVIDVVLTTALGTLAAFLYNLSANILGGLELTLAED